jgi:AcrR family transcriptional regulator
MVADGKANGDTRERILDAAEQLFVERGFEATTLRMITARAGVNLASVNYHFGSKEELVHELFRRRLTWLNHERLRALESYEEKARGGALKPSQVLDAFFGTSLRMAADTESGGHTFMRLLGRTYSDPNEFVRNFLAEEYAEVVERFTGALYRALPSVPRSEILWRFHFMLGAMAYALAGTDALQIVADKSGEDDPKDMAARLMSFLLGGLRAPLPDIEAKDVAAKETRSRGGRRKVA